VRSEVPCTGKHYSGRENNRPAGAGHPSDAGPDPHYGAIQNGGRA
jgi:hypothetical protein